MAQPSTSALLWVPYAMLHMNKQHVRRVCCSQKGYQECTAARDVGQAQVCCGSSCTVWRDTCNQLHSLLHRFIITNTHVVLVHWLYGKPVHMVDSSTAQERAVQCNSMQGRTATSNSTFVLRIQPAKKRYNTSCQPPHPARVAHRTRGESPAPPGPWHAEAVRKNICNVADERRPVLT